VFFCTESHARSIQGVLRDKRLSGALKFNWWVQGSFDDKGRWRYSIESNDRRLNRRLRLGFLPAWSRKAVNADLITIADEISNLFQAGGHETG